MAAPIMNPRMKKFADEYLISGNLTQSVIKAGYSKSGAHTTGNRLLRNTTVAEYLASEQAKLQKKEENRRERIIAELEKLAFANIGKFIYIDEDGRPQVDFTGATPDDLAAITSVKSKTRHIYTPKGEHIGTEHQDQFSMADKLRGLELLGKVEGMFRDNEVKVTVDVADRLLAARERLKRLSNEGAEDEEPEWRGSSSVATK